MAIYTHERKIARLCREITFFFWFHVQDSSPPYSQPPSDLPLLGLRRHRRLPHLVVERALLFVVINALKVLLAVAVGAAADAVKSAIIVISLCQFMCI